MLTPDQRCSRKTTERKFIVFTEPKFAGRKRAVAFVQRRIAYWVVVFVEIADTGIMQPSPVRYLFLIRKVDRKSEKLDLPVVKKSVRVLAMPVNALLVTV
jgi:hypothetical protein